MQGDHQGMKLAVIGIYTVIAALFLVIGFWGRPISPGAEAPSNDVKYWKTINQKFKKGYFVAAVGGAVTAVAVALTNPLVSEIGCITVLAALVFNLAILCRKLPFKPGLATQILQKRWKTILLLASIAALLLTQLVFRLFINA